MRRRALFAAAAGAAVAAACAPVAAPSPSGPPPTSTKRARDLLARMAPAERVGQLMSVAFHGRSVTPALEAMIRERRAGGVIVFKENFDD
ncbi:MAG: hypothetical protein M3O91_05065, partial [Chloroflexota bacterium]|nr:hypothetical protein [Chloroflexota bacterium]